MSQQTREVTVEDLTTGFDHELALLKAGLRRIVKMEFSDPGRIASAQQLGFVCRSAIGTYGIDSSGPDIVYGSGEFTTVFVGTEDDVSTALNLEELERGPDPEKRQVAMRELGALLGYPACCTESYRKQMTQNESASFARLLGTSGTTEGHFANNLFVLEHQLISHFPCSLACTTSANIGLTALELCREQSVAYAEALEALLRSPIQVWDRFRFQVDHPNLGLLYPDTISAEQRVHNHPSLQSFLSALPLLPDDGTWVYWNS